MQKIFALSALLAVAAAQNASTPTFGGGNGPTNPLPASLTCGGAKALISQNCPYPYAGPPQLDSQGNQPRGPMQGTNLCNSTTEGGSSECVIAHINNASDFCFFSNPKLDLIANGEGETVAYCVNKGYGTRYIPGGTIQGLQVVYTPSYVAFGMFIDQTMVNVSAGDPGGELDPHGADGRGNPIGSIVYSTAFGGNGPQQIVEWNEFIGGNMLCMKICLNDQPAAGQNYCENVFDTIGCNGNVPLGYGKINGTFQVCQGDNQQIPNGSALPIPATSSCVTYASSDLFSNQALPPATSTSAASSSTASAVSGSATTTRPGAAVSASGATSSTSMSFGQSQAMLTGSANLLGLVLTGAALAVGAGAILL